MLTGPQHIAVTQFFKQKQQELNNGIRNGFSYNDSEIPHTNTDGEDDGVRGRCFSLLKENRQYLSLTCFNTVQTPSELLVIVPRQSDVDETLVRELTAFARTTFNVEPTIQR